MEFSRDGKLLASCSTDGVVRLGTLEGAPVEWKAHTSHVMGLAWSPDGKWLATGAKDYKLKIWDAKSKAEKVLLGKLDKAIVAVATSPDGTWLATGSEDKTVRLWAVK